MDIDPREFNLHKLGYSIREVLALGIGSRATVYHWIRAGELRVAHYGRKTVILAADLAKLLRKLRDEGLPSRPLKPSELAKRMARQNELTPPPPPPRPLSKLKASLGRRKVEERV
jgi:hypothetical protein